MSKLNLLLYNLYTLPTQPWRQHYYLWSRQLRSCPQYCHWNFPLQQSNVIGEMSYQVICGVDGGSERTWQTNWAASPTVATTLSRYLVKLSWPAPIAAENTEYMNVIYCMSSFICVHRTTETHKFIISHDDYRLTVSQVARKGIEQKGKILYKNTIRHHTTTNSVDVLSFFSHLRFGTNYPLLSGCLTH